MDEVITSSGASSSSSSFRSASSRPSVLSSNVPFLAAFLAFALAQLLKLFTIWFTERRWDSGRIIGSGGMPSAHSATLTALAVAIGLHEGAGSPTFAVALVLACVVMYDASGVRLHAGRQAKLLNQIVCELPPEHPVSNVRPLRGSFGHTPLQAGHDRGLKNAIYMLVIYYFPPRVVVGAGLGCFIAFLMNFPTGIYGQL